MKQKKGAKKGVKSNLYYTPATWSRRLRQKLERGDPPGECLRYSHQKDEYPEEVQKFIGVASKVEEATKLLSTLIVGSMAPLSNSVGEVISSSKELSRLIELIRELQPDIDIQIRDHLLKIIPKDAP